MWDFVDTELKVSCKTRPISWLAELIFSLESAGYGLWFISRRCHSIATTWLRMVEWFMNYDRILGDQLWYAEIKTE
jgi:hypothetical protein